ncbi:energy transducer TonB [Flavitalea sp.]|nr:energy transducer TonB [Flavitalea sp.]
MSLSAQKNDTIRKYLDDKLQFTSKAKSSYLAMGIKQTDSWLLFAVYPDASMLLKAYYKDKNFSIKNGSYLLFHGKNVKAMEGSYVSNVPQGLWRYWHSNGQLKDSGLLIDNVMCGLWQSWSPTGKLLISLNYAKEPSGKTANPAPKKSTTILPEISPYPGEREGLGITYHLNGQMQDSGMYKADSKTGLWKTWYANGTLSSEGNYQLDSITGNWTFYRENGNKSTEETYRNGKLQSMTCYDSSGNKEGNYCSILKPPFPLGPFDNFSDYVLDNVFWPKGLLNSNIQGKVKVEYVITKNGDLTNFKIVESPHQLFSDEVTRFFSTIEKWSPAISHNRVIDFPMQFEVPFYRQSQ